MHAYFTGNAGLCDALIRNGAHTNTMNKQGVTIFNAPVATKQLLFRILSKFNMTIISLYRGYRCYTQYNYLKV